MGTQAVRNYLTKQIFIQRSVVCVTYRTLSRALQIHVNEAKNELAAFHAIEPKELGESVATYFVSGERTTSPPPTQEGDYEMNNLDDEEPVTKIEIMLVSQSELEEIKAQMAKIHSIHIHSLAASVIRQPALLFPKDDTVTGDEVGKIVSPAVKRKTGKTKTKTKAVPPKPAEKPKPVEAKPSIERKPSTITKAPETKPTELKARPSGKLDFSKAKTKEQKAKEKAEAEAKGKAARETKPVVMTEKAETATKGKEAKQVKETTTAPKKGKETATKAVKSASGFFNLGPKKSNTTNATEASSSKERGTKRKVPASDTEAVDSGEESSSSTQAVVSKATSGKKKVANIVYSDDEEASDAPRTKRLVKGKKTVKKAQSSDEDDIDMISVDDDDVEDLTHRDSPSPSTVPPTEDEEIHSESDGTPPPQKKPRKPKKVIPVGSNGIKKRRVIRTRTKKDEKGYDIREDYSSYESVGSDEEEPEEPKKKKAKVEAKAMQKSIATESNHEAPEKKSAEADKKMEDVTRAKMKETSIKKGSSGKAPPAKGKGKTQPKLANFFGPPIQKK